jgi:hypothetical protein
MTTALTQIIPKVLIKDPWGESHGYYNQQSQFVMHRDYDLPARIETNGLRTWAIHGLRHRENGPAHITETGSMWWYQNDRIHRLYGPAFISGNKVAHLWYVQGIDITEEYKLWRNDNNYIPRDYKMWNQQHKMLFKLRFA